MSERRFEVRFLPPARRAIALCLPETVAAAVLELAGIGLATDSHRIGKPPFWPLAGCHGARRGTYRIIDRIDDQADTVYMLDIAHGSDAYRAR